MIAITTVGYGNIVATTPLGRISVIITIVFGAFLMGLLVTILLDLTKLEDKEDNALENIQCKNLALQSIKAALTYNVHLQRRIRSLRNELKPYDEDKHIYTRHELNELKNEMISIVSIFGEWRFDSVSNDKDGKRDEKIKAVSENVNNFAEKFDLYLLHMLESGKLRSHEDAELLEDGVDDAAKANFFFTKEEIEASLKARLDAKKKQNTNKMDKQWRMRLEAMIEEMEQEEREMMLKD